MLRQEVALLSVRGEALRLGALGDAHRWRLQLARCVRVVHLTAAPMHAPLVASGAHAEGLHRTLWQGALTPTLVDLARLCALYTGAVAPIDAPPPTMEEQITAGVDDLLTLDASASYESDLHLWCRGEPAGQEPESVYDILNS